MYDHGNENRHTTLIAGLILVIVLAAVAAFASLNAPRRVERCPVATAVPATSVFLVDVSDPITLVERLSRMGLLADAAGFMAVIGERGGLPFPEELATILEDWNADPGLRADLEAVAGRRAGFLLLETDTSRWPVPLLALRGSSGADPPGALGSLATRLGLGALLITGSSVNLSFAIADEAGQRLLDGSVAEEWVVVGPQGAGELTAQLAGCLAGNGPCPDNSLATLPEFERTLAMLPDRAPIHGYLNVSQLRELVQAGSDPHLASLLDATDGIGFARTITDDRFETWATGHLETPIHNDARSRLLAGLAPVDHTLSVVLPEDAIATYELGASPAEIVGVLTLRLETLLPEIHAGIQTLLFEFRAATGLDPKIDLLPFLGRGIAIGILPAEEHLGGWPLPRPVLLARSTEDGAVRSFAGAWLRWEAGALAPMTQGILGGMVVSQWVAGAALTGLQLDSLVEIPLPLPSPTVGVVDGLVIVSPVRSAVVEILEKRVTDGTSPTPAVRRTAAVETMRLNLPAWPEAWRRAEGLLYWPALAVVLEPEPIVDVARSLMRLLGRFDAAEAATTVNPDGDFLFHAVVIRKNDTTIDPG